MANKTQLLKGILEGCILKVISQGETYGYEIGERLSQMGLEGVGEGSTYPLLIRLEKNALVQAVFKESPFGPKRKYYVLTEAGQSELKNFEELWANTKRAVDAILGDDNIVSQ